MHKRTHMSYSPSSHAILECHSNYQRIERKRVTRIELYIPRVTRRYRTIYTESYISHSQTLAQRMALIRGQCMALIRGLRVEDLEVVKRVLLVSRGWRVCWMLKSE